ncbi:sigma-70 family RNA polymerase sigma factor [Paenibacillus albidus]|uniref:sigma-70 family RNA polymerase sigma factor n=1 Tax=Paenibacillus albidus TaxID=2041023 RepID=UPI001BEBD05A|nr:sigma-70 family RNA polymerase sigma factor [Paenibacillus albidus]MBT2293552.1 sigma-70 family RNA polymerase sigma factor [Paenibacillus albidus]
MEELYLGYKRYAFSIAYRMLGTVADAEDAVQDCFAELARRDRSGIVNVKAYIAKGITNRCLNILSSARSRRETYAGEWLPEPISEHYNGPEALMERKDTLSYAFLVLLERLTPTERAVFVLREVFEYDYDAIAEMLGKAEANCRKIFSRAKRNLQPLHGAEPGSTSLAPAREALLKRFVSAFAAYDVSGMLELLAEQPVLVADGGGRVHTVLRPMHGRKGVLALLTSRRVLYNLRECEVVPAIINGEPNLVFYQHGEVKGVLCLDISGARVQAVYLMLNPGKLGRIDR